MASSSSSSYSSSLSSRALVSHREQQQHRSLASLVSKRTTARNARIRRKKNVFKSSSSNKNNDDDDEREKNNETKDGGDGGGGGGVPNINNNGKRNTTHGTTSSSSSSGGSSSEKLSSSSSSSGEQDIYNRSRNNNNNNGGGGGGGGGFGFSKTLNDLALKAKDVFAPDATSSAPPPVAKDSTMDPLEAILAWHLGSSTSTTLTSQEVSDTIVNEVTSFPANKLVRGQSPSVAMHLPIPFIRAHERKFRGRKELAMGKKSVMEKEMTSGEIDDVTKIDIDDSNDPLLSNLRIAL